MKLNLIELLEEIREWRDGYPGIEQADVFVIDNQGILPKLHVIEVGMANGEIFIITEDVPDIWDET